MEKGELWEIYFWDHSHGIDGVLFTKVVGYVTDTPGQPECSLGKYIAITNWRTHSECEETNKANEEVFNILTAVITKASKLKDAE